MMDQRKDLLFLQNDPPSINIFMSIISCLNILSIFVLDAVSYTQADDDAYLNIPRLLTELRSRLSYPPSFYCHVIDQVEPIRKAPIGNENLKWLAPYWMYPWPR